MPRPRKELVCIEDTPYYHITSRCVRRSFLCGIDPHTGQNFEHRRQNIEARIRILASIFAIDICAYAVMSNHYHIVIKLNPEEVGNWTDDEVLERWTSVFKGPPLVQKHLRGDKLSAPEKEAVQTCITRFRKRLGRLGWLMKCLNEPIARQANKEDNCTGHFWEARYTSQALLTEEALLSAMAYVDLNPVRAQIAKTPEDSAYTSIRQRLTEEIDLTGAISEQLAQHALMKFDLPLKPLVSFEGAVNEQTQPGILFSLADYIELVDYTGRILRDDKRGAIAQHLPPILQRLTINQKDWLRSATQFEKIYHQKFYKPPDRQQKKAA